MLCKTTNGVTTKYVYGNGLIGEAVGSTFKTYHFDCRGSTIAITDAAGNVTDTFAYDTYGKMLSRTGTSKVIFGYNGRDGVVTDDNGLIYMRARYYSPEMKRFINADIIAGAISNAITLNRYAYANGNPVSFIDPFGLWSLKSAWNKFTNWVEDKIVDPIVKTGKKVVNAVVKAANKVASVNKKQQEVNARIQQEQVKLIQNGIKIATDWVVDTYNDVKEEVQYERKEQKQEIKSEQSKNQKTEYEIASDVIDATGYATDVLSPIGEKAIESAIRNSPRPNNIGRGTWAKQVDADIAYMNKGFEYAGYGMTSVFTILNTGMGVEQNIQNGESTGEIISDAAIDIGSGAVSITTTILLAKAGTVISPGWGTAIGLGVGLLYDFVIAPLLDAAFE